VNARTIAELDLRRAQLAARAETLREEWLTLPAGPRASTLGKRIKAIEEQAGDYAAILAAIETKELRKAS
jgi:acyl-CoA reductase-like NAD-dependent aldehyde dehydrogenase